MTRSIEDMRRPALEVVDLPTDKLDPNPANPNRIPDAMQEALRAEIDRGFVQPVVVRPEGGRWRIHDGEHRWRILRDRGDKTVPCVIDAPGEAEGDMRMLTMNQLRGRFAPAKLAKWLAELQDEIGEDELRRRLGMGPDEYAATVDLAEIPDDLGDKVRAMLAKEIANAPEVLRFRFGPRQLPTVEGAVAKLTEDGKSRAEALLTILEAA